VQQGSESTVGDVLCVIHTEAPDPIEKGAPEGELPEHRSSQITDPESAAFPHHAVRYQSTRFSRRALERLQELGRVPKDLEGRGLVRLRDIESSLMADDVPSINSVAGNSPPVSRSKIVPPTPNSSISPASHWKSAAGVEFDSSPLSRSKKLETKLLSWSSLQTIRSTVSVIVPTLGHNVFRAAIPDFSQAVSAQIMSAAATLLKEFPGLNACCLNDEVRYYRDVHLGFAVDAGHGLKVAVIRSADQLSPEQLREARDRLVSAYLEQTLEPEQLNGATFTISDLSGVGVSTFDPLISEGQSAILGIGSETGHSDDRNGYQLILSFDHRLAEGRLAAMFLNRIREQMIVFERGLLEKSTSSSALIEPRCSRCGMTSSKAAQRQHYLTETVTADWTKRLVCTICLQGR
jgi:pyruvate/2-oxoglutarate dehydrogenase complex dihydrolipoamide acyltransferase (E2) component